MERASVEENARAAARDRGWQPRLARALRCLALWSTGLLAALTAVLALAQIVCLALCLLALTALALCFLMASCPQECRQFWRMLREERAEGRGRDA